MLRKIIFLKLFLNFFFKNNSVFLWKIRWLFDRLHFSNDMEKKYSAYIASRKNIRLDLKEYLKILPKYLSNNNLEIGCNFGHTLTTLAKKYPKKNFYGQDISYQYINFLKKKFKNNPNLNFTFKKINYQNLDKYGTIFTSGTLMYFNKNKLKKLFKNFKKYLIIYEMSPVIGSNIDKYTLYKSKIGVILHDYKKIMKETNLKFIYKKKDIYFKEWTIKDKNKILTKAIINIFKKI